MPVFRIGTDLIFPAPELAESNGLLAVGGDLSPQRLVLAYQNGIFPWFNEGDPICWWSPDPRCVLKPQEIKIRRSLQKVLKSDRFSVSFDQSFRDVMWQCSRVPRPGQDGTWITKSMLDAYFKLFELGIAHSVEVWQGHQLAGGLYGICLGPFFFGESMFFKVPDASKVALVHLCRRLHEAVLIDCQVETPHLMSLGAHLMPRSEFVQTLNLYQSAPPIWESKV